MKKLSRDYYLLEEIKTLDRGVSSLPSKRRRREGEYLIVNEVHEENCRGTEGSRLFGAYLQGIDQFSRTSSSGRRERERERAREEFFSPRAFVRRFAGSFIPFCYQPVSRRRRESKSRPLES